MPTNPHDSGPVRNSDIDPRFIPPTPQDANFAPVMFQSAIDAIRYRSLLERIRHWDHLDTAEDGKYWKKEIDEVLKIEGD